MNAVCQELIESLFSVDEGHIESLLRNITEKESEIKKLQYMLDTDYTIPEFQYNRAIEKIESLKHDCSINKHILECLTESPTTLTQRELLKERQKKPIKLVNGKLIRINK